MAALKCKLKSAGANTQPWQQTPEVTGNLPLALTAAVESSCRAQMMVNSFSVNWFIQMLKNLPKRVAVH